MKDRIFTKFCGITNSKDALNAEKSGCNAMGFVFVEKSKRYIDLDTYLKIQHSISPLIVKVALFSDNTENEIERVINSGKIHIIQFHGNETPEFCEKFNRPYWKAIPMKDGVNILEYANKYPNADAFIIDNYGSSKIGGSGETFDWNELPKLNGKKWILAGGITSKNVIHSLTMTSIKNIDLSSGIEKYPGKKSYKKMKKFINKIKEYND
jgi:phosphoribosylanthranilate isomerase